MLWLHRIERIGSFHSAVWKSDHGSRQVRQGSYRRKIKMTANSCQKVEITNQKLTRINSSFVSESLMGLFSSFWSEYLPVPTTLGDRNRFKLCVCDFDHRQHFVPRADPGHRQIYPFCPWACPRETPPGTRNAADSHNFCWSSLSNLSGLLIADCPWVNDVYPFTMVIKGWQYHCDKGFALLSTVMQSNAVWYSIIPQKYNDFWLTSVPTDRFRMTYARNCVCADLDVSLCHAQGQND
jgi:hypothetical protein